MNFKIISLNIGKIKPLKFRKAEMVSAYAKAPVEQALLSTTGFGGDEQADLKNHGGEDKAVCVYSAHHFSAYKDFLSVESMPVPAFGENFTVDHLSEEKLCIGDVFSCGEVRLQISQPRQPCAKTGMFHKNNKVIKYMSDTGSTGFYFRVLSPGLVKSGSVFSRESSDEVYSLSFANDIMYRRNMSREDLEKFIAYPSLSQAWKKELSARLK
ncbi:MAG: MOSC domain-containing protein [Lentisphaeraceae bacterium]|nr:MOSC domain-containing protein [Lentisphaeraceae bacterium]